MGKNTVKTDEVQTEVDEVKTPDGIVGSPEIKSEISEVDEVKTSCDKCDYKKGSKFCLSCVEAVKEDK